MRCVNILTCSQLFRFNFRWLLWVGEEGLDLKIFFLVIFSGWNKALKFKGSNIFSLFFKWCQILQPYPFFYYFLFSKSPMFSFFVQYVSWLNSSVLFSVCAFFWNIENSKAVGSKSFWYKSKSIYCIYSIILRSLLLFLANALLLRNYNVFKITSDWTILLQKWRLFWRSLNAPGWMRFTKKMFLALRFLYLCLQHPKAVPAKTSSLSWAQPFSNNVSFFFLLKK